MKIPLISLAVVLTASTALAGGRVAAAPPPSPAAESLADVVRAASLVVIGKVLDVRAGRSAGLGEGRVQFNDVRVMTEQRLKGDPPATIVLEQVASAGATFTTEVGPPYRPGERYVLFLRAGQGHRHVVLPQGRYRLERGTVHPIGPGPVAARVAGSDEAVFVAEIAALSQNN